MPGESLNGPFRIGLPGGRQAFAQTAGANYRGNGSAERSEGVVCEGTGRPAQDR